MDLKKTIALMLASALLAAVFSCSKPAHDAGVDAAATPERTETTDDTAAPSEPPFFSGAQPVQPEEPDFIQKTEAPTRFNDYASAAAFYFSMIDTISATALRLSGKGGNSSIFDMYAPFNSGNMRMVPAAVGDAANKAEIESVYVGNGFQNVNYEVISSGNYRLSYEDEDETGGITEIEELVRFSAAPSIRYERTVNGETVEFFEFVALGGGSFALQGLTDRAIVEYDGETVKYCFHTETAFALSEDMEEYLPSSVLYDPNTDSIWERTGLDKAWTLEKLDSRGLSESFEINGESLVITVY